jgi:sulfhydrogenase subunit beta (sulfur reductase)
MYTISRNQLLVSIKKINQSYPLVTPVSAENNFYLKHFPQNSWDNSYWFYAPIRTAQPLKSFFYPPQQKIADYPAENDKIPEYTPKTIIGVKACDVAALKIIDRVYGQGDYPDPSYVKARNENIIISSDCLDAGEYCACTLMNHMPYTEDHYDLNISPLKEQFLVEIGSDKGREFFNYYFPEYKKASQAQIRNREALRQKLTEKVKAKNEKFKFYETHQNSIEKHLHSREWHDLSKTCVECGTCTQICPTCHCFLLYDQPTKERYERIKVWDSCFFAGYSRMAGGLTPRLSLGDRFKNRFYHKFDSFITNFGVEACTGCGRCSEGCMGKIDLREVLLELEKRIVLKEKMEIS